MVRQPSHARSSASEGRKARVEETTSPAEFTKSPAHLAKSGTDLTDSHADLADSRLDFLDSRPVEDLRAHLFRFEYFAGDRSGGAAVLFVISVDLAHRFDDSA